MRKRIHILFLVVLSFISIGLLTSCKNDEKTEDNSNVDVETDLTTPGQTDSETDGITRPGQEDGETQTPPATEPGNDEKTEVPPVTTGVSSIVVGNLRVQLLSESVVRIENKGPKGFEDRPSYIVPNRTNWETVEYTEKEENAEKIIETASYQVHIPTDAKAENVYITDLEGEKLWSYSDAGHTDTNVYLPSPSDELKSWYFTDSPRVIPSEYGYSDVDGIGALQEWDFKNDAIDAFVFLPNGNYEQFTKDYVKVTGESEMVSLQTLGFWDSRWYAYSAETAIQQIKDYRDRGYSIDVMVIDTDWRMGASHGYQINTQLFPDMAGFLEECEDMGIDICFNDHPEPVGGTTNGLDKAEVDYRNEQLTLVLSLGLDYWWYDRNWSVCLNSVNPDISVFAFGMYAYQWITQDYRESITDLNEFAERSLIMGNVDGCLHGKWNYASDLSAHRYSIQWTGDIGASSEALAQEIYASVFGGSEVGLPYMSSDIGGHTQSVSDSMYARWIQYGALSTICRVHCTNASYIGQEGRMPWLFGETAEEVAHSYIDMRYRLLPLYYALARDNYDTGLPIMRRLDILYPEYVEASRNDQYLLGDYIIVAPIEDAVANVFTPNEYLTHEENGVQVPGLKAEYYTNDSWSGTPAKTQVDSNINFDWGHGGPAGMGADNYSIKWSGQIKIGNKPAALSVIGDDTVKLYIDGALVCDGTGKYDYLMTSSILAANSTHNIEVHYAEFGYNAHVYMYYVEQPLAGESIVYNSRTVFIPEGTWIDVWSGDRFVGPKTYTVTHPLETSPIFVREGSLITLAPNMSNVREKDWSEMVLDVYPSKNYAANTTLYEDDTRTVAYKKGEYRTTDITMSYDENKGALIITVNPTVGTFTGDRAFETRKWNVRLHTNPGWGDVLYAMVNGQVAELAEIAKSSEGVPFAFTGPSLDGNVMTFAFEGSIREKYTIEVYYDAAVDSKVNAEYEQVEVPFNLSIEAAQNSVNLTDEAIAWISYGENNGKGYEEKKNQNVFSTTTSYDTPWLSYDSFFTKNLVEQGTITRTSIASQKDFALTIKTGNKAYYVLYVGGNQATAKITVRDTFGNVRTEYFGNIDGNFLKRIVIECPTDKEGTLYVTYSMVASETNGTGSPSFLTMIAAIADTTLPEAIVIPETTAEVEVESLARIANGAETNLSVAGEKYNEDTLDWMQFGDDGGVNSVQKINGTVIESVLFQAAQGFGDYKMRLSYYDGEELRAHSGTYKGKCTPGGITISIKIDPSVKHIILYTGCWNSSNTIEVYSRKGTLIAQSTTFRAGETATNAVAVIGVTATEEDHITIYIRSTDAASNGNVSLAAIAVTGEYQNVTTSASLTQPVVEVTENVDLTAAGYQDWIHVGANAEMDGADLIGSIHTPWANDYDNYDGSFSYSNGTDGSAEDLKTGKASDYLEFDLKVDENTEKLVIYATSWNALAALCILDSNGQNLLVTDVFSSAGDDDMKSFEIHINIEAQAEETLRVIYIKGGNGSGNVGIAAVAVK